MKKAKIHWSHDVFNEQVKLPNLTTYYATTEKLEDGIVWSVVIKFDLAPRLQQSMIHDCTICFLFDNAPHHLLVSSRELKIFKGKEIAKIIIE